MNLGVPLQWCLRNNTGSLSWECKAQLFRRDLERSGDVRLSVRLLKKCLADKQKVSVTLCANWYAGARP